MLNKEVKVDQIIANPYEPTKDEPTEPEVASTTKSEQELRDRSKEEFNRMYESFI